MAYDTIRQWLTYSWEQSKLKAKDEAASGNMRNRRQVASQYGVCFAAAMLWGNLQLSDKTNSWGTYTAAEHLDYKDASELFQTIGQFNGMNLEDYQAFLESLGSGGASQESAKPEARPSQIATSVNFLSGMRAHLPNVFGIEVKSKKRTGSDAAGLAQVINLYYKASGGVGRQPFVFAYQQGTARHAVGIAFDDDYMYFFEPNAGEYCVEKLKIADFIEKWVVCSAEAFGQTDTRLAMYYFLLLKRS